MADDTSRAHGAFGLEPPRRGRPRLADRARDIYLGIDPNDKATHSLGLKMTSGYRAQVAELLRRFRAAKVVEHEHGPLSKRPRPVQAELDVNQNIGQSELLREALERMGRELGVPWEYKY
jgi:hypothetical protein